MLHYRTNATLWLKKTPFNFCKDTIVTLKRCFCMLRFRPPAHRPTSPIPVRTDRIELAECDSQHEVKAKHLGPLLNSYFHHRMYTVHSGRGFESDELHESFGVFGAVAPTLQSDPT